MKRLILSLLLLGMVIPMEAQNNQRTPVERTTVVQYLTRDRLLTFISTGPPPVGSVYLQESWNNIGIIEMNDGSLAKTRNINFNIDSQRFESTFAEDSVHAYNRDEFSALTLNNRRFIPMEVDGDNVYAEQVYKSDKITIYKTYSIKVYEGSYNPMISRYADIYKKRSTYWVDSGNGLKEMKLNKKHVLKLFSDKAAVEAYVEEQDLSFKNELDVQQMLRHFLDS